MNRHGGQHLLLSNIQCRFTKVNFSELVIPHCYVVVKNNLNAVAVKLTELKARGSPRWAVHLEGQPNIQYDCTTVIFSKLAMQHCPWKNDDAPHERN